MTRRQYRHGDLLLVKVNAIPNGVTEKPRTPFEVQRNITGRVLAEGEATGHAHIVDLPTTSPLYEKNGKLYFHSTKVTPLTHDEHAKIELPAGTYEVIRQREHTPQGIRNVED